MKIDDINFSDWSNDLMQAFLAKAPEWGMRLFGAIIVFFVGWWVIKWIDKLVQKYFDTHDFDLGLESFLASLASVLLKIFLVLSVAATLGIELTSFMAIFGSAGLAIGLALSGTLSNFAGGIIILIFKPYKVGDVIEAQGYTGKVESIQIFNTVLKTLDTKTIIIPNGKLSTESLVNYSVEEFRRVIWTFSIAYGDDANVAKHTLIELLNADDRVLRTPDEPFVAMTGLADSSVNFSLRAWTKTEDFWQLYFDMNERVYNVFPTKGLNIPFPQMDVHVRKDL